MKKVTLFANASVASILIATAIATPAFACHPAGSIVKEVQDQTTNSVLEDANTASTALTVNSGDTVVYTVTVKNTGAAASNGDDDMTNVVMTDTLPSGVQLVSAPTQTKIIENLGTIEPGASVTKTYAVKITDTTNGDVITNTACYTGGSVDNNDNQQGCDSAVVKVNVPVVAPTTTTTPTITSTPSTPTALPDTGSTALSVSILASCVAILAYGLNLLRLKLHAKA